MGPGEGEHVTLSRAHERRAALGDPPPTQLVIPDTTADTIPCLDDDDRPARAPDLPRRRQTGEPGANDHDIGPHGTPPRTPHGRPSVRNTAAEQRSRADGRPRLDETPTGQGALVHARPPAGSRKRAPTLDARRVGPPPSSFRRALDEVGLPSLAGSSRARVRARRRPPARSERASRRQRLLRQPDGAPSKPQPAWG